MKKTLFLLSSFLLFCTSAFAVDYCADASMKAAWYMNETSGTLADCTTNANTCTASGSPGAYNATGKFVGAFDFQEVNNAFFNCGSAAAVDNLTSKSGGGWIYPDTDGNAGGTLCDGQGWFGKNDGNDGWIFCQQTTAQLRFRQSFDFGAGVWTTTDTPVVYTGFQHFAFTYNGSSTANDPIFYKDGASRTITENAAPFGTIEADAAFTFRKGILEGTVGEADARLDEIYYYSGILTSTQINDIKDNGLTITSYANYRYDGTHYGGTMM